MAETNVIENQLNTGQMEMATIADAVKDSGAFDVTFEEGAQREVWEDIDRVEGFCNKKHHQASQTELTTNYSSIELVNRKQ